jgi:predicted GNAT superfamily acetyltransferase
MPANIRIRDLVTVPEIAPVEELQMQVWGKEPRSIVPVNLLYIAANCGGILLGAFHEETLVGFAFGLLGRKDGELYHASHMLGVLPDYRGSGIGEALKLRQRERALAQDLSRMTWTFDPLEARNAYLNLHKLGARTRIYGINVYGAMQDHLNRGLPSDRLTVEWLLRTPGIGRPQESSPPRRLLENRDGRPVLHAGALDQETPLAIAVPASLQRLKADDPQGAMAWRLAVRDAFCRAFALGYVAVDFRDGEYLLSCER